MPQQQQATGEILCQPSCDTTRCWMITRLQLPVHVWDEYPADVRKDNEVLQVYNRILVKEGNLLNGVRGREGDWVNCTLILFLVLNKKEKKNTLVDNFD